MSRLPSFQTSVLLALAGGTALAADSLVLPGAGAKPFDPQLASSLDPVMPLEQGWEAPPRLARTRVWWWWLNGHTDKETITRELEAMKSAGIGGANIIDAGGDNQDGNRRVPHGPDFGSAAWRELFRHAMAEAARLDLEMGFNIQSGWNLGGPSVSVEDTAKRITWSALTVEGGARVDQVLPQPEALEGYYRDAAVIALPARGGASAEIKWSAISSQTAHPVERLADGDPATFWVSGGKQPGDGPKPGSPAWIEVRHDGGVEADGVILAPRPQHGPRSVEVQAMQGTEWRRLALLEIGEPARASIPIRFPATRAKVFRLLFSGAHDPRHPDNPRNVQIAEVQLVKDGDVVAGGLPGSGALKDFEQKAYYRYPGAFTATEAWHLLDPGPGGDERTTPQPREVIDLTQRMDASGRLRWDAPSGRWEILRIGYTPSGAHVSTHSENAGGRAIDYLDRGAFDRYWQSVMVPILDEVRPYVGKSLRFLHTDSWELGPVNWTPDLPAEFKRLRGYEIKPWLPVLAGRVVGSRGESTRFLNDFRRTLADLMARNKYASFAAHARALGMGIHPESGGPHAGPMDALLNLGISDVPMGEFWSTSPRHRVHDYQRFFVKQTTSAAHVYGRRVSLAEAFTNIGRHWQHSPRTLKATFDQAACEGHNLTMWHTFPSSPAAAGLPGYAYFAGEHLHPNITWWPQAHSFISFMNRCHFMLQQGVAAFDVLHFYGENIPSFVRLKRDDPARCLPGYDYDVINQHALLTRVDVDADGWLRLPEGTRYRLLSLPAHDAMSLATLRHIGRLVERGATVVGPRPQRPFSLGGGAAADKEFAALTAKLWGDGASGSRKCGKGRVIWGKTTREVLQADGVPEDFSWRGGDGDTFVDFYHKRTRDAEIYYVANRNERPEEVELAFRVTGMVPELWDPVAGTRREASRFRVENGRTFVPLPLDPWQSWFVIFRKSAAGGGNQRDLGPNVPTASGWHTLEGSWEISFDPALGGPGNVRFDELADWTSRPEPSIRHYSGAAIYRKSFGLPSAPPAGRRVLLDLGNVRDICEITLNGRPLGVCWNPPFRVDVTGLLRQADNLLEVKVVNLWANRVIGDAGLPPEKRLTRTNITRLSAQSPLEPSGMTGPVRILTTEGRAD